jgi:hypothetical protein
MIDSDEISPHEDLINPWRLAKGDLEVVKNAKGKVSRAIPSDSQLTICKELVRRGVWPHHYGIYGDGFLELRNAFRAPGAYSRSAALLEIFGLSGTGGTAADIYIAVCKKAGSKRITILEYVLEQSRIMERFNHHDEYKDSMEILIVHMDAAKENFRNEK